jgi:hypothetical protein
VIDPWQVEGRHQLLHLAHDRVHQHPFDRREQVADLRDDQPGRTDRGGDPRQRLLQVAGEVGHDDDGLHAGILVLMLHLPGRVERVGVDHRQPRPQRPEQRHRVLQHVRHLQSDAVALGQPQVLAQEGGELAAQLAQLPERERDTHVRVTGPVGESFARGVEHVQDRPVLVGIDGGRDPLGVALHPGRSALRSGSRSEIASPMRSIVS